MVCPKCKEENKKSHLYLQGGFVTCMGYERYYDEDGNYHSHDTNVHSEVFNCSNGHRFSVKKLIKCQSCDFGKDSERVEFRE